MIDQQREPIVQQEEPMTPEAEPRHVHPLVVTGMALLVVGLLSLTDSFLPREIRLSLLIAAGLLFLVWGVVVRYAGPLIAGGIMTGIGTGVLLAEQVFPGASQAGVIALALGIGFLIIYPLSAFFTSSQERWALIPGGILAVVGAVHLISGVSLDVFDLLLVLLGAYFIWEVYRRSKT
jgi:hypothetical protein